MKFLLFLGAFLKFADAYECYKCTYEGPYNLTNACFNPDDAGKGSKLVIHHMKPFETAIVSSRPDEIATF